MGMFGASVGALMGLTTKFGSNALQKLPWMRQPWEHVFFVGAGAFLGGYVQEKYYQDLKDVEEMRLYLERNPNSKFKKAE